MAQRGTLKRARDDSARMGTKKHSPPADTAATTRNLHDDANPSPGAGIRPGTKSRVLEARERAAKKK